MLQQVKTAGLTEAQRTSQVRASVTKRIQLLGRQKRPKEAVTQLAEMARLGVQPDTQAATALIDACVRNRKMDMAQSVFEELFGKLSKLCTGMALVRCCNPHLRGPYQQYVMLSVPSSHRPNDAGELLQPDDVTFSVLMRGYGEMKPPSWVLISGLLKMMEKQFQMKPSLGTYHTILHQAYLYIVQGGCEQLIIRSATDSLCLLVPACCLYSNLCIQKLLTCVAIVLIDTGFCQMFELCCAMQRYTTLC